MKNKKVLIIIVVIAIIVVAGYFVYNLVGKTKTTETKETSSSSTNQNNENLLANDNITINGIYLNQGHTNKEGLKQIVVFYTIKAGDKNIDVSSNGFNLKINNTNTYSPTVESDTPNFTEYYYSEFIEHVYVGKTLNVAATFNVPDGDLSPDKDIELEGYSNLAKGIKLSTNDIKNKANYEEISQDIDPESYASKKAKEDEAMTPADDATTNKVREAINDYYFTFPTYLGQAYISYKVEFSAPNNFDVSSRISGSSISNSGTYSVTNGYILLTYSNNTSDPLKVPYSFNESGEIELDNPFPNNGQDKIF